MKLTVFFKTPDAVDHAIDEAFDDPDCDEAEDAEKFLKTFCQYGEVIAVEFDTEAKTATVLRRS